MRMNSRAIVLAATLSLTLACGVPAFAQNESAAITGRITDPKRLPGAQGQD